MALGTMREDEYQSSTQTSPTWPPPHTHTFSQFPTWAVSRQLTLTQETFLLLGVLCMAVWGSSSEEYEERPQPHTRCSLLGEHMQGPGGPASWKSSHSSKAPLFDIQLHMTGRCMQTRRPALATSVMLRQKQEWWSSEQAGVHVLSSYSSGGVNTSCKTRWENWENFHTFPPWFPPCCRW